MKRAGLSIVIPSYNAESWLMSTVGKLYEALNYAAVSAFEIIIVNDGSSDETLKVAKKIANNHPEVRVITQTNKGRYLTRKKGVKAAIYDRILFLDTRVWIDQKSIYFLMRQLDRHPDRVVWNGHINVAKKGNIIARFGDVLTLIGWRRYFKNPRLTSYGVEDFDHYPKGTGLFTCSRQLLIEAMEWFEGATTDIKNSSDDTLLIRYIAGRERIWLAPKFSATYHARTSFKAFIKHSYYRGQFFVDGFLRKGTRFYYPIIAFLIVSPIMLVLTIMFPALLLVAVAVWALGFFAALLLGMSLKDSLSLLILAPAFVVAYGAGIWRMTIRKVGS